VVILDPNNIQPLPPVGGQEPAPGDGEPTQAPAGECGETYTVATGDTPSGIAEKCGVTTQELLDANPGLDPTAIHAGDVLNIPQGGQ
jgi:LysM repeat protein